MANVFGFCCGQRCRLRKIQSQELWLNSHHLPYSIPDNNQKPECVLKRHSFLAGHEHSWLRNTLLRNSSFEMKSDHLLMRKDFTSYNNHRYGLKQRVFEGKHRSIKNICRYKDALLERRFVNILNCNRTSRLAFLFFQYFCQLNFKGR